MNNRITKQLPDADTASCADWIYCDGRFLHMNARTDKMSGPSQKWCSDPALSTTLAVKEQSIMAKSSLPARFVRNNSSVRRPRCCRTSAGDKFGPLTVIGEPFSVLLSGERKGWCVCQCDCGNVVLVKCSGVGKRGRKLCGATCGLGLNGAIRNRSKHKLYNVWSRMKDRCSNPGTDNYRFYGARGISVCDEWTGSSDAFIRWAIANGWKPGLEIDRRDNNGNYEPGNCRFVTRKVNMGNVRARVAGHKLTLERACILKTLYMCGHSTAEVAEIFGVSGHTASATITGRMWPHAMPSLTNVLITARLTAVGAQELLRRCESGEPHRAIARSLGISRTAIKWVIKNQGEKNK